MDFLPGEEQRAIAEAVEALLAKHAGPERAVALARGQAYDDALDAALAEAGFRDVARGPGTGALEAALVVEAVARAAGSVAIGAGALVAPQLTPQPLPGPIALAQTAVPGLVRFGGHARTLLLDAGEQARRVALESGEAMPVASVHGYPFARMPALEDRGEGLGAGSGERLRAWWRVALAVEAAGTMRGALDVTLAYVKARRQFGRAIGSFQAVQHRLAACHIQVEAARWLALEAAWRGAPAEASAAAAAWALDAASLVFRETHQFSGALGYTREHPLHVWSMRLQALRFELGGVAEHRRSLARARWGEAG